MDIREKLVELIAEAKRQWQGATNNLDARIADHLIAHRITVVPETGIGDMSDGYHTFNELYHHRAILFSVICNLHPLRAWKAKKHHDGTMYNGMFIVGINTLEGQATYHYDLPYWDMFRVPEVEFAPEWDGHTADEAARRIGSLGSEANRAQEWISVDERLPEKSGNYIVADKSGWVGQRHFYKSCPEAFMCVPITITHWMPLPAPPEGG